SARSPACARPSAIATAPSPIVSRTAERYAADLADQVAAGETVMSRIARIVESSREAASFEPRPEPVPAPAPAKEPHDDRLGAAVRAAQALSERAARRRESRAA
ncbi:MAG TPA: glutamyl-tRNA reductase, partial [Beijerinckiaceae bacterium]|nr:glutamyl-tRNA reductase [Beijerinckiaceae bacterium]